MPPFPNAPLVNDFIESETDPAVRCVMRLVYGEFLHKIDAGERPDGACHMMYCFTALQAAFRRKEALANALKGNYGDWRNIDWLPADWDDEQPQSESAQWKAV
jgi:hypothetical protein